MGLLLRKSEFATMLSIGMGRKQLGKMIILEGILHGFIASIFGSAISYGVFKLMMDVQGEYIDVSAEVPIGVFIIGCVGTILITLMASLIPLRKLKSMSIVENMRAKG
ncbi:FtsX-like permease family protein [Clostridium novyi]|uniref:FtsX-like permease family protein n=1 Tax=Clostridium novyi TaxID=1542 RepID=UPI000AFC361C|nr:ABC transporter permease [Clostridium novyi]